MYVSPPIQAGGNHDRRRRSTLIPPTRLGYFNLHGLQDANEWFGQRDPAEKSGDPDYPIALRPEDVVNGGRAPSIVFSEACYGANIIGKKVDEALALKFLASGSIAVVGSTCTSYGSITPPLIAADLLGHAFWRFLQEGLPVGEALRRGKIHLAKEMHRRQGYLDGEDQKTLISFVLYGDPLATMTRPSSKSRPVSRALTPQSGIKIVCDKSGVCRPETSRPTDKSPGTNPFPVSPSTMAQVKRFVEEYLPGFKDAELAFSRPHLDCAGQDHDSPASKITAKSLPKGSLDRNVITLKKQIITPPSDTTSSHTHRHFARLTLDEDGTIVKLAVSR
jgi:hypothetical protein